MEFQVHEEDLTKTIFNNRFFWFIVAIIIGYTLSLMAIIFFPQETAIKTVIAFSLLLFGIALISAFSSKRIIDRFESLVRRSTPVYVVLSFASIFLPFLLVLIIGENFSIKVIEMFVLWYCVPIMLMIMSHILFSQNNRITFFLIIGGVVILWLGMDHRYTLIIFDEFQDLSYNLTAIWIVNILLISYSPFNLQDHKQVSSKITFAGIKYTLLFVPILMLLIAPLGLFSGFLSWNPNVSTSPLVKIASFIGIYLTIALPEEFIFRGVILNEFDKRTGRESNIRWLTLVFVSLAFGSTHWNNTSPEFIIYYILFATIAGITYGYTWRKTGLFGAALLHTTVDWIWAFYFQ